MFRIFTASALAFSLLESAACTSTHYSGLTSNTAQFTSQEYDYIIVGSGTAGLTVAARLTEDRGVNVGVIEAGQLVTNDTLINTPFYYGQSLANPGVDWSFSSVPQPNMNNRSMFTPRGKVIGGSSALNFMVWSRASAAEYDAWGSINDSQSDWDWQGLLPYFKKSESVAVSQAGVIPGAVGTPGQNSAYHGKSGPVKVSFNTNANFVGDLAAPYVQALVNAGVPVNSDPDNRNATGVFQSARTVDSSKGVRSFAATSYLVPNLLRKNLLVLTGARARKILWDKPTWLNAWGVEFSSSGKTYIAEIHEEVILCAGAIQSPQILELSGIGRRDVLSNAGIKTLYELPGVGENLMDHVMVASDYLLKDPSPHTWDVVRNDPTFLPAQEAIYAKNGSGILAATSAIYSYNPVQTFINATELQAITTQLQKELKGANLTPLQKAQYASQQNLLAQGKVAQIEFGMVPASRSPSALPGRNYITMVPIVSRPMSRGSVHIKTSDPQDPPTIDYGFFSFSFDSQVLSIGLRALRKLAQTKPLADIVESPANPPASVQSDADFIALSKETGASVFHASGTAAMAPKSIGGVVDTDCFVYGTVNVRVIDASIIPVVLATHLQATVYALAEKAADIIREN